MFRPFHSGKGAQDDVRVGSVSRPGGAQPLRCLETARHLRLQHGTDPLRLDLHKHSQPRRERTVHEQGPAAGWEQNTGDKGTIKWDAVSLNSKNTVK